MRIALVGTAAGLAAAESRPDLKPAVPAGTELSAWPSRVGVLPSTPVERDLQAIGFLEAGMRAAASGVDAIAVDSFGDYGLAAMKVGLGIPVASAGESGIAVAAALGRFAIVTVWPASMNFTPEGLIRTYGHEDRCVGIYNVGAEDVLGRVAGPDGYLAGVNRGEPAILLSILAAIDAAKAAGAEAILLGCTCMSPMAAKIAAAAAIPVINPLVEALKRAVALTYDAKPAAAPIVSTREPMITRMIDAIAGQANESCPVCVVSQYEEQDG